MSVDDIANPANLHGISQPAQIGRDRQVSELDSSWGNFFANEADADISQPAKGKSIHSKDIQLREVQVESTPKQLGGSSSSSGVAASAPKGKVGSDLVTSSPQDTQELQELKKKRDVEADNYERKCEGKSKADAALADAEAKRAAASALLQAAERELEAAERELEAAKLDEAKAKGQLSKAERKIKHKSEEQRLEEEKKAKEEEVARLKAVEEAALEKLNSLKSDAGSSDTQVANCIENHRLAKLAQDEAEVTHEMAKNAFNAAEAIGAKAGDSNKSARNVRIKAKAEMEMAEGNLNDAKEVNGDGMHSALPLSSSRTQMEPPPQACYSDDAQSQRCPYAARRLTRRRKS